MIDISFSDHRSVSIRSAVGQRKVHHLLLSATQLGQSVRDGIGDYLTAHGDFYPRGVADDGLREEDGAEAVAATVSGFQRGEVGECPVGSHLAVIAYSTRGTHILYHDRGVIHILLRQRAGRGGKAEADREAVHYVAEVEGNGTVAFHTVEGGGMKQVGGGVLLLGALVGGQGEFLDCFHVGACREKGKEIELGAVAESFPRQVVGFPCAVAEDSGIYHSGFGAVLMGDEYLRFVTVVEAARAVVVDGGSCAGVGGGITACETGDSSGEADGVAVVRAAIGSRCIILRAGR